MSYIALRHAFSVSLIAIGLALFAAEAVGQDIEGALVVGVDPRGPAAKQGLRPGDVISMVGQRPVASPEDVKSAIEDNGDRDHTLFRVERNGGSRFVAMKLA